MNEQNIFHPALITLRGAAAYLGSFDWNLYMVPGGFAVANNQESPEGFYAEVKTPDAAVGAFNRHYFAAHQ